MIENRSTGRFKPSRRGTLAGLLTAGFLGLGSLLPGCSKQVNKPIPNGLNQKVELVDSIDIKHSVFGKGVYEAMSRIIYNGTSMDSLTEVVDVPSSRTLEDNLIGNYQFIATAENVEPDTAEVDVPDYPLEIDDSYIASLPRHMQEGGEIVWDLEQALSDENIEHTPYITAVRSDGNTEVSFENYDVSATGLESGLYDVEIDVKSGDDLETITISGEISEFPEQIAFWSNRDEGTGEIYTGEIVNNQLINLRRLTTNGNNDISPSWSSDGSKIVWSANRATPDGWFALYMVNVDGGRETRLTPFINNFSAYSPVWAEDERVYFNFRDRNTGTQGIARIKSDGTNLEKVVEELFHNFLSGRPAVSPDGSEIAFVTDRDGNVEIYLADSDGTNQRNLTNHPSIDGSPDWSPDGNSILFKSYRFGSADLYLMDTDGTSIQRLTYNPGIETDPAISSDGRRIIFTHDIDMSNPQIYLMDADGTGEWTRLTFQGANRYPAWRPRPYN